jgi:hypothetical protein
MGWFMMGRRGLGRVRVRGRSLVPKPPARITASMVMELVAPEISVRGAGNLYIVDLPKD